MKPRITRSLSAAWPAVRNPVASTSTHTHTHLPSRSLSSTTSSTYPFPCRINPRSLPSRPSRILSRPPFQLQTRSFRATHPRKDVFFVAFPALKGALLSLTRISLVTLPFVWRWKLWQKYRRASMILVNIPIMAFCLVLALGLDQSPRTNRWRLLLMSENEELAWSTKKFEEVLTHDGPLLLPSTDPRTQRVARVSRRLIQALSEEDHCIVHGASWPPRHRALDLSRVIAERERAAASAGVGGGGNGHGHESVALRYEPSARASSAAMPFRPESANPLKVLEGGDWSLYVVDLPKINAFALPSKDIFVYAGLIDLVDDDTLLSAVLAHEIAHVTQRHAVENLGFLNIAAVAFDVLRGISFALTISFPLITDSAGIFINWLNNVVAERAYSRKLEMEADSVGLNFMATAGYDPRAALDLWDLMSAVEADAAARGTPASITDRLSLLQTHPTSHARQEALLKIMPQAMKLYKDSDGYRELRRKQIEAQKVRDAEAGSPETSVTSPAVVAKSPILQATSTKGEEKKFEPRQEELKPEVVHEKVDELLGQPMKVLEGDKVRLV